MDIYSQTTIAISVFFIFVIIYMCHKKRNKYAFIATILWIIINSILDLFFFSARDNVLDAVLGNAFIGFSWLILMYFYVKTFR